MGGCRTRPFESIWLDSSALRRGDLFLNQVVPKSPNRVAEEDDAEAEERRLSKAKREEEGWVDQDPDQGSIPPERTNMTTSCGPSSQKRGPPQWDSFSQFSRSVEKDILVLVLTSQAGIWQTSKVGIR